LEEALKLFAYRYLLTLTIGGGLRGETEGMGLKNSIVQVPQNLAINVKVNLLGD